MLKPPSGNCRDRIRSTARLIWPRLGGFQTPFDGRMQPQLKQDVIGFERGVGGQQRAPVAIRVLQAEQMLGGALQILLGGGQQFIADLRA